MDGWMDWGIFLEGFFFGNEKCLWDRVDFVNEIKEVIHEGVNVFYRYFLTQELSI
jgi:hypothetical protein